MKGKFITITGMKYYYGLAPFAIGKKFTCIKEPDNPYDDEAIMVIMKPIGKIGYVANSTYTKANGTLSAGRIHDQVKKRFVVKVVLVTEDKVICKVVKGFKKG